MKLKEIAELLELEVLTGKASLNVEVSGGYTSDLLSDVIANSREGDLWITLMTHQNIVAVGKLKDLAGILLIGGRRPDEETMAKAERENLPILGTEMRAYQITGLLYQLVSVAEKKC
jgi:predicted transcriptional regulator